MECGEGGTGAAEAASRAEELYPKGDEMPLKDFELTSVFLLRCFMPADVGAGCETSHTSRVRVLGLDSQALGSRGPESSFGGWG